ncbi:MAG: tetratricopeptide repeat protein, partial [Planctomycetota bacterium]
MKCKINLCGENRKSLLICLVLAAATFAAFEQVRHNDFINFDDPRYVTENAHVKSGLTFKSVIWAFSSGYASNWHPVTWISHMVDYELFGMNASGHHMMNLLFHIVNSLLLFLVLKMMTNSLWPSAFVAASFALHSLHVESVAWISERKDVLSTLFWLLTMAAYVRYDRQRNIKNYLPIMVCLALGLMAKPMLVTLPFVLLLLDYWPLGRLQFMSQNKKSDSLNIGYLIAEKIPLFALAAMSSVITFLVQQSGGAVETLQHRPLNIRIGNAIISSLQYIIKMIWPSSLAPLYPHPGVNIVWQHVLIAFIVLAGITAVVIKMSRSRRYLAVGWLWYIGTLVPVIGIVQVGIQSMADRYAYVPLTGIFIMIAWLAAELSAEFRYRKIISGIAAVVVLTALLLCTRMQVRHWKNSISLFEHTLSVTKNNYSIHNNYGGSLCQKGDFETAIIHFKETLRIYPNHPNARYNLGLAFAMVGQNDQAILHLKKAIEQKPNDPYTMINLAR